MYASDDISGYYKTSTVEYKRKLIMAVKKYPKVWNMDVDDDEVKDDWEDIVTKEMGQIYSMDRTKLIWETIRSLYFRQIFIRTIERRTEAPQWPYFHDMSYMYEIVKEDIQYNLGGITPPLFRVTRNPFDMKTPIVQCPCCIYIFEKPPEGPSENEIIKAELEETSDATDQNSSQPSEPNPEKKETPQRQEPKSTRLPPLMRSIKAEERKLYQKKLINAIKKQPLIYDLSTQCRINALPEAWKQVSKEMDNIKVAMLKGTWNWLRNQYIKDLVAECQSQKPTEPLLSHLDMEFLKPFVKKKVDEVNALRMALDAAIKDPFQEALPTSLPCETVSKEEESSEPKDDDIKLTVTKTLRTYCRKPKIKKETHTVESNNLLILQNRPLKVKVVHPIDLPNNERVINENNNKRPSEENLTNAKKVRLSPQRHCSNPESSTKREQASRTIDITLEKIDPTTQTNQKSEIRSRNSIRQYSRKSADSLKAALTKAVGIPENKIYSQTAAEKDIVTPVIIKVDTAPNAYANQSCSVKLQPVLAKYVCKNSLVPKTDEEAVTNISNTYQSVYVGSLHRPTSSSVDQKALQSLKTRSIKLTPINGVNNTEAVPLDPQTLAFLEKQSIVITPLSDTTSDINSSQFSHEEDQITLPYQTSIPSVNKVSSRVFPLIDLTWNDE